MNRSRGYTLIEVLAVIAAGAVVMAIAVGLLHLLIRLDRDSREEVSRQATLHRLADQFRRDVRAAGQFAAVDAPDGADAPSGWQFALEADRAVRYAAEEGELVRTERAADDVVGQESYALPADSTVSIEAVGEAAPGIVRLRIAPDGIRPPAATWRGTCVDAELAKDRRFLEEQEP